MRKVGIGTPWTFIVLMISSVISCSSVDGTRTGGDADVDSDVLFTDSDAQLEGGCGNGHIDDEEECDDSNRLNGDGCDWQCQFGNGEPRPDPDPSTQIFGADGPPIDVDETPAHASTDYLLPLESNGSEFATTFYIGYYPPPPAPGDYSVLFQRYNGDGDGVDAGWNYPIEASSRLGGTDLVWTGEQFGLFYYDQVGGIFFLALDAVGKPLGDPVEVVSGWARAPSAAWNGDHYILTWVEEGDSQEEPGCRMGLPSGRIQLLWAREVGPDGYTSGYTDPTLISDRVLNDSMPTVAATSDGYGIFYTNESGSASESCTAQFVSLNHALEPVSTTHSLSSTSGGEVISTDDGYLAAWIKVDTIVPSVAEVCTVRFSSLGDMIAAPVCGGVLRHSPIEEAHYARLSSGADGFGVLFGLQVSDGEPGSGGDDLLLFQRLDGSGVSVGDTVELVRENHEYQPFGRYALAFSSGIFGALYESQTFAGSLGFRFQRLIAE